MLLTSSFKSTAFILSLYIHLTVLVSKRQPFSLRLTSWKPPGKIFSSKSCGFR